MISFRIFPLFACLFLVVNLTVSCKQSGKVDTTAESNEPVTGAYKEAIFLEPVDFQKGMKKSGAVLLDVRQPQEFEQGHIEGAININFFDPTFQSQLLGLEKDKKYYLYCKNASRSERSAEFLQNNDFKDVYVLKGGFEAWEEAGLK